MQHTDLVDSVRDKKISWHKQDTVWMLSLYGTAIGAGILFLPINAGRHGIIPLIMMLVLSFPITYFSHLALCRFVLSGSSKNDITEVVDEHFGSFAGKVLSFLYFFSIYPILLMYSVALTNTTISFIENQMQMSAPPRVILALLLVASLMLIIRFGQKVIVKFMSILVYPFVSILILLSIYLIPQWNSAIFNYVSTSESQGIFVSLWLLFPVLVFSFNHSPIISAFALNQKETYGVEAEDRSRKILLYCHILMVCTVMFFVFSCVLSLSPTDLESAKIQNITILSYLANRLNTPIIAYIAPLIAFIAISKSFFGHYLGASEGLRTVFNNFLPRYSAITENKKMLLVDFFIILTCWVIATINPNILRIIETLAGPVIAMILFIMPMYAILTVPAMRKYRTPLVYNLFTIFVGLIATSAITYNLFYG